MAGVADGYPGRQSQPCYCLREERIDRLLGVGIELQQAEKLLRSLGLKTERRGKRRKLKVVCRRSRPDLTREAI